MTTVMEVANILKKNINPNIEIEITGEYRKGDIRHNYADLTLAKEEIGFKPTVDVEEGLKRFCDWMLREEEGEDKYEESLNELKEKDLLGS